LPDRIAGRLLNGKMCFGLDLDEGDALRLELDQVGADLSIAFEDHAGEALVTFDTPVGMEAPERPCFVASSSGRHTLRLTSFGAPNARYALHRIVQRIANGKDRACWEATERFVAAKRQIRDEGVSEEMALQLETVADLWNQAEEPLSEAMARREVAWVLDSLGRFSRAEAQARRALAAAQQAGSSYLELSSNNRLGIILLNRAQIEAAATVFNQALAGARAVGDRRAEASALNNLALIDETKGNVPRAIERLREAAAMQRQLPFPGDLAQTLENLGTNLALLDYHQEALDQLEEGLVLARQAGFVDIEAHCNLSIGWVHRLRGQPRRALAPLRRALQLWRSSGDLPGQATALDRLGTVLAETEDSAGAFEILRRSLKISTEIEAPMLAAPTQANLACLHQETGEFPMARRLLRQLRRSSWHFLDPKGQSHVHFCAARLEEQTGNLPEALEQIDAALEIVERMKSLSRGQGARHRPIWLWQDYAELRVRLLVELAGSTSNDDFLARALSAADEARARSLSEMVLEPRLSSDTEEDEAKKLQQRLQLLGESRRRLLAAQGPDRELSTLEKEIAKTVLELKAAEARRRARKARTPSVEAPVQLSLGQMQSQLTPGTLLLRYFLTTSETFLFAVQSDDLTVHRLAGRKVLEAQAEALHSSLRRSAFNRNQAELQSQAMARALFPSGVLKEEIETLLIVADGALHYVPFSALPMPGPVGRVQAAESRLLDHFGVRYLPSIGIGLALARRAATRPLAPREIAILADPVYSLSDPRLREGGAGPSRASRLGKSAPEERFPRLVATADEAATIQRWFASKAPYVALAFNASKNSLLDPRMEEFRILHLATHAFVDERFPELSGLVFSRYQRDGTPIPGEIYLHELPSLHLNADLTVLSACQTALGRRVRGDGLLGLTQGFFHAGSSQVMVSLWSVDDQATAALMAEFYRTFSANDGDAAGALRDAQRWLQSQEPWRAPYFWAPFILQGVDPRR